MTAQQWLSERTFCWDHSCCLEKIFLVLCDSCFVCISRSVAVFHSSGEQKIQQNSSSYIYLLKCPCQATKQTLECCWELLQILKTLIFQKQFLIFVFMNEDKTFNKNFFFTLKSRAAVAKHGIVVCQTNSKNMHSQHLQLCQNSDAPHTTTHDEIR